MPLTSCPGCSKHNPPGAEQCVHCGASLLSREDQDSVESRNTLVGVIAMAIVFGCMFAAWRHQDWSPPDEDDYFDGDSMYEQEERTRYRQQKLEKQLGTSPRPRSAKETRKRYGR